MRQGIGIACVVALLALPAVPARADLILSVGDAMVAQGGTGTIDVYLSSTASPSSPDTLNDYSFQLQITPVTAGNLAFSAGQDFGYLNHSSYIFYGNSADYIAGLASPPPIGGTAFTTVYANDSFLGFDSTNDLTTVSLSSGSGPILLASLTLDASITSVGEAFTVSVVPSSGDGSSGSGSGTYFNTVDTDFTELSAVPYTSSPGTVTIVSTAVPEPATILQGLTAFSLLAGYLARRRSGRRHLLPG